MPACRGHFQCPARQRLALHLGQIGGRGAAGGGGAAFAEGQRFPAGEVVYHGPQMSGAGRHHSRYAAHLGETIARHHHPVPGLCRPRGSDEQ